MREIKFRVWHKEFKRFLGKEEYCLDLDGKLIFVELQYDSNVILKAVNPLFYILQQFTGLKDKNSKEIYEGDIVKTVKINDTYPQIFIGGVVYNPYDCCFIINSQLPHLRNCSFRDMLSTNLEILGNIFEKSDLLK